MPKEDDRKGMTRCLLTGLWKDWCAHCRGKSLTDEEQEKKDLDDMIKRLANG